MSAIATAAKGAGFRLAKRCLKGAAIAHDTVRPPAAGIVILIYHRIGHGTGGEMDIAIDEFDRQIEWLSEHHDLISLDDATARLQVPTSTPRPAVALTFDDGTTDWVDHALPVLERHCAPATFYVATRFVEQQVAFPSDGRPATWAALTELASSPFVTIGSHTHTHALLDRLKPADIGVELDRSVELLRDHLGVDPRHFAYPKAVAGSPAAESAVRHRFETAVLSGTRSNQPGTDLHRLSRSPVQASDGPRSFRQKAAGGMRFEDDIRLTANRVRYRKATS